MERKGKTPGRRISAPACLILVFFLLSSVMLSGCRRSEVLEQKIYTDHQETDWQNETKEKENKEDNPHQDQEITSKMETPDAQTERNQTDSLSAQGSGDTGSTPRPEYSENAAPEGETPESAEGTEQGTDTAPAGIEETAGIMPAASGDTQAVEENGEPVVIPDSYSKVAAVGPAAVFVEILGGPGRLKASSADFTGNSLAVKLFTDLGEVQTLWSGDGSAAVADENLEQLIRLLTADSSGKGTCLYDEGSLTGEQVHMLNNAGIDTYPVSLAQNSSGMYKDQVMAIGKILGGEAEQRAGEYCEWYDRVLRTAESCRPEAAKYTLYLSGWDSSASWQVADRSGSGLAIAPSKSNIRLFNEYLSTAGVENRVSSVAGEYGQARRWYVSPLLGNGVYTVNLTGTMAEELKDDEQNKLTSVFTEGIYLGSPSGEFPSVIAADRFTAQNLSEERLRDGLWKNYGLQSAAESTPDYGMLIGSSMVRSTVHGEYDILTLPRGITGNWASGTPEAVLSSMWAAGHFGGTVSENDVRQQLASFYETFCGAALTDSELSSLLEG